LKQKRLTAIRRESFFFGCFQIRRKSGAALSLH
jgi:hypothetical protein